jgi:hypothetical protein
MSLENHRTIDVVHKPNDNGRVCLAIIDTGVTSDPAEKLRLAKQKIRTYLKQIAAGALKEEFPDKEPGDFFIRIVSAQHPGSAMEKAAAAIAAKSGIKIDFKVRPEWELLKPEARAARYDPTEPRAIEESSDEDWDKLKAVLKKRMEADYGVVMHDGVFSKVFDFTLVAAEICAKNCNFVFGLSFDARGKRQQELPFFEGEPVNKKVNGLALRKASNFGKKLPENIKYYAIAYTTLDEGGDPTIVVEGWKRGVPYGISYFQDFERMKGAGGYCRIKDPYVGNKILMDIFGNEKVPAVHKKGKRTK